MRDRRSFADRFWDLPGLSWIADDPLTACLAYLAIGAAMVLLGLLVYIAVTIRS